MMKHMITAIWMCTAGCTRHTSLTADDFTPRSKRILQIAVMEAAHMGHNYVGTEHLLLAVLQEGDSYGVRFLEALGVRAKDIESEIVAALNNGGDSQEPIPPASPQAGAAGKGSTKTLDQFGRDLTALAAQGGIDPVIGRKNEIERVVQILSRRTKNNPCLIGEPGVGKTAVVEGLEKENKYGRSYGERYVGWKCNPIKNLIQNDVFRKHRNNANQCDKIGRAHV